MGFARFLLFGCGSLGVNILASFFFQWIVSFPVTGGRPPGAPADGGGDTLFVAAAVGALFLAFRIFDGITDPIAGLLGDGWVKRGRERRSLLWFSFLVPPVGLALIFSPTLAMDPSLRWLLLGLGMFVFFVGYTLYVIPYWSLIDDYSGGDEHRRTRLSNINGAGVMVGASVVFLVSGDLVESRGFFEAAAILAAPAAALMILPFWAQPPDVRAGGQPKTESSEEPGLFDSFKIAFRHRKFLAVIALFSGAQMALNSIRAAVPFFATDLLGGTKADVKWMLIPLTGTAILSFFLIPALSRRVGWERLTVISCTALAVVYMGAGGLGKGIIGSPMTTATILFGLAGPMVGVMLAIEGEAVTSCARDSDGEEVTSVYFGVFNFIVKALNGLAITLTGVLATVAQEGAGTIAIRAMGILAGVMLVIGLVLYLTLRRRARPN